MCQSEDLIENPLKFSPISSEDRNIGNEGWFWSLRCFFKGFLRTKESRNISPIKILSDIFIPYSLGHLIKGMLGALTHYSRFQSVSTCTQ